MRNHTCLLDHHQRSHYDTNTIGPEGMMNWVLKLINNQQEKLFDDSHEEKFLNMQRTRNKSNQSQNQSLINKGNLITRKTCLLLKVTSRSHEINEKCFHEELCSSDRLGQLDITPSVIRARNNLSENIRVEQTHDRSGQPDERNSSKTKRCT